MPSDSRLKFSLRSSGAPISPAAFWTHRWNHMKPTPIVTLARYRAPMSQARNGTPIPKITSEVPSRPGSP